MAKKTAKTGGAPADAAATPGSGAAQGADAKAQADAAAKKGAAQTKAQPELPPHLAAFRDAFPQAAAVTAHMSPDDWTQFAANLTRNFELGQEVWTRMMSGQTQDPTGMALDPFNTMPAFLDLWSSMLSNPGEMADKSLKFWSDQTELWRRATLRAVGASVDPMIEPERGDRRFADPEWSQNLVFDALKQSYLLTASYLTETAHSAGELDAKDRRKVEYLTRQFIEAVSPTNYFATNPEVLRTTFEEKGANLVRGLQHVIEDLERGKGSLLIRQTDLDKFKVGENVAITKGEVIFRNDLMELIQYAPTTQNVEARPVLICPPWINKYYILDLNPKKSMVKWLVDQGHTVFMISWVNPDERHADVEFVDYIADGLFEAVVRVLEETQAEDVHVAAYCIGGTMTGSALAYLSQQPDHPLSNRIASATFFTSQFDFNDAGELQLYVDDEQLQRLSEQMSDGYLGAEKMAMSFNMLRASDLIWSFVINNYLLGKEPFPFDLLYWNADSTNLPAKAHRFYLEKFYRDNAMTKGELTLGHVTLDLGRITMPSYHVSTKEDHIAPATSVYRGVRLLRGERRFIMAGSGHIAGVVNPPALGKYQHWVREDGAFPETLEDWRAAAEERPGSWWGDWDAWLKRLNVDAGTVPAREPGRRQGALAPAPGAYVRARFDQPEVKTKR